MSKKIQVPTAAEFMLMSDEEKKALTNSIVKRFVIRTAVTASVVAAAVTAVNILASKLDSDEDAETDD